MLLTAEEREEFGAQARRFLDEESSSERVRDLLDEPLGYDEGVWKAIAEMGWLGIHVPEAHGGAGGGHAELGIVLHEIGRHLTPTPVLSTAVLAIGALLAADNEQLRREVVPRLAAGEQKGTAALTSARGAPATSELDVTWEPDGAGVRLRGEAGYVTDASAADEIVVAARGHGGDGLLLALVPSSTEGVEVRPTPTTDRTRRLGSVGLRDVRVPPGRLLGEPGAAGPAVERLLDLAAVAVTSDALGGAERVMEMSARHASEREQFGRPIGVFQAVKHKCADMVLAVEGTRAAVEDALARCDDGSDALGRAASVAKSFGGDACAGVCADGVQVHGGIGFTWEHDMHLHLKRSKLDQALFGTPSWHRRRLARSVLPAPRGPRRSGAEGAS